MKDLKLEQILADKENLERILDNLMEGIIAHDTRRRIQFFNREAERITGYPREEVLGRDCHAVFGAPFCGDRCSFCEGPPNAWQDLDYPLNILARNGEMRRIEMRVTGMKDKSGTLAGVVAAIRDVSDVMNLQIQLGHLTGFAGIIGQDPKMRRIFKQIRDLAATDYPIHIMGETGTGKELVAAAIHNEGRRRGRPFVPINCGALPEGVLESELFGHVRGAFTGAHRDKKGRFELADGGTIFLDEVADLPKPVQVKLLRVLQEGTFERLGGEETVSVNVRVISATNRDLKQAVAKKLFREDLFYRINVVPLRLPSLRERKNDIPLLARHFLTKAVEEGQKYRDLSPEALRVMMGYSWPGNIRELQSAIRFSLVHARGSIIKVTDLPIELRERHNKLTCRGPSGKLDEETVRSALTRTGGNKAKAARLLGVGRATLYRFLNDVENVS
jgi:sigma-54 dependent transcriptional regulator, acetoin dehydrogenase operon transcriptional activator AcoR